jgi:threonine synthase
MKTMAYEIAEQLTIQLGPPPNSTDDSPKWRTPDWYVQAVSGGMGPLGVYKGFCELKQLGLIDHIPALAPIQADGCAPMVLSWKKGLEKAEPVLSPQTRIETLATGDPGRTYTMLRRQVNETNGVFESVSDEDAFRAMHVLAKMEGISAEPAAGVAFAGLFKLVRAGIIKPTDTVVVNCTDTPCLRSNSCWRRLDRGCGSGRAKWSRYQPSGRLALRLNNVTPNRFPIL